MAPIQDMVNMLAPSDVVIFTCFTRGKYYTKIVTSSSNKVATCISERDLEKEDANPVLA